MRWFHSVLYCIAVCTFALRSLELFKSNTFCTCLSPVTLLKQFKLSACLSAENISRQDNISRLLGWDKPLGALSDGCEVQQMVAKLCFSTKREDNSFILSLSRCFGRPFSLSHTHTYRFITETVRQLGKYTHTLICILAESWFSPLSSHSHHVH